MSLPILSVLLLLPVVFAFIIGFLPQKSAKGAAVAGSLLTFAVSLLLFGYQADGAQFQFQEKLIWLPDLGIGYHVGIDGAALLLIVMTTLLQIFAVAVSPLDAQGRSKEFYIQLMLLETAMLGTFCALDLVLFFIFFEACLIPAYFLIGIWGGRRREAAGLKFLVYTVVGSLVMLVGILALFLYTRTQPSQTGTFDVLTLKTLLTAAPLPATASLLIFLAFAFAFAIKTPLFPFHSWLPDTYAESPTAGLVMSAAVLSKLGTYGFYRFCIPLFPDAAKICAPYIIALAVIGIIYGAIVAVNQRDAKRLVAYSSLSHLGFIVLGLFAFTPIALTGAVLQMVNHGISTGALFLLIGMLQERRGTTQIRSFGGLWETMPVFGRIFLVVALSSIALPLTNGFVGEFMILLGSFQTSPVATIFATTGVIWSAIYMLRMVQYLLYGQVTREENRRIKDLSPGELIIAASLIVIIFLFGIYPKPFSTKLNNALAPTLDAVKETATVGETMLR